MKRRDFLNASLKSAAAVSVAAVALPNIMPARVLGANERVRFALIGCGGRGRYVARGLVQQGAELVYLCDLHSGRLDKTEAFLQEVVKKKPRRTKEMQEVFDDKSIDAVVVATPDRWHAPATIMACQAGKDVYVEKPHAYNMWESHKMIEAARKYDRVLQVGTQNRSAPYTLAALEYVRSGKLGRIGLVKVYNLKPGKEFWLGKSDPKPPDFNWDRWLGSAPERPYHSRIFNYGWHKFWDFCGGDMCDDGIHQLDLAMMLMGDPGLPGKVTCIGDRKIFKDDRDVPDVEIATYEFDDFIMTFEMTNYPRYMQKTTTTIRRNDLLPYWTQNATRIELYGSDLMMTIGRHGGGWQVTTSGGKVVEQMYGRPADDPHYENFLQSVKEHRKPNADIAIAHNAFLMVQMANIAHRVGNTGLTFDVKNQKFVGHKKANAMIKTPYRKKYEIPDKI